MKTPFFSIVIPTYNSYTKLLRAIDSIQNQSYLNFEIIIVDDGSSDDTKDKIKTLLSDKIHYFYKENGGPASARNVGIKKSKGEYICFLDADDEFFTEKLSVYSKYCIKNNSFIFSDAQYYNENLKTSYIFSSKNHMKHDKLFSSLLENNFIVASTVCVKRNILQGQLLFDEDLKLKFVEDYDLWLKILHKYSFQYVQEPLTKYYIHDSNNSSNVRRTYTSLIRIYLKWSIFSIIAMKNLIKYNIVKLLWDFGLKK